MIVKVTDRWMIALLAAGLAVFVADRVHAQAEPCSVTREVSTRALDEMTWRQLNGIYEDVADERYDAAYDALRKMLGRAKREPYLQAIINQALAQVEWSREKYQASLGYYEEAVRLNALPDEAHFALMYQVAQLYYMQGRYDEALERLQLWFCKSPDGRAASPAYVLLASIHTKKERYDDALKAIETAIELEENPSESWYQLKLAAHYELEQYPQATETLEVMISRWPDTKLYWMQLSRIYDRIEQDGRSLAVYALAYRKGLLDRQSDILYLSGLYSRSNVPYKAAAVLEQGIRDGMVESNQYNWTVAAESWYMAEELEKALAAFQQAGQAANDGAVDLRRGFILVELERWPAAQDSLNRALEKGGLDGRRAGEAYLLRGIARYNLGDFEGAASDWNMAGRHEKTREAARQWLNHLRVERNRAS